MIYIALGANLPSHIGNPEATLRFALQRLEENGFDILKQSSFYQTTPVPKSDQPNFINAVIAVKTEWLPRDIMKVLHAIEQECGREREEISAARTLDLDLLDYNGETHDNPALPHPRMAVRAFVLVPLQEITPDWRDPKNGAKISDLIASCDPKELKQVKKL